MIRMEKHIAAVLLAGAAALTLCSCGAARDTGQKLDEILAALDVISAKVQVLGDRKSTRLNSSHRIASRMPSSA